MRSTIRHVVFRAAVILALIGFALPASAQLTGGLEGHVLHHVFEAPLQPGGRPKVVAEAWYVTKTGELWVRGKLSPEMVEGDVTMRSAVYVGPMPEGARVLTPSVQVIASPTWLKRANIWARPADGVADTAIKFVLPRNCSSRCEVVAIEHYQVVGGEGPMAGPDIFVGVDRWPVEPGDRRTVYAPR